MLYSHMWLKIRNVSTLTERSTRHADLEGKYSNSNQCTDYSFHPRSVHTSSWFYLQPSVVQYRQFPELLKARCDDEINLSAMRYAGLSGSLLKGSVQLWTELRPSTVPPPSGCDVYRMARDDVRKEAHTQASWSTREKAESLKLQSLLLPLAFYVERHTLLLFDPFCTSTWYSKKYVLLLLTSNASAGLSTWPVCLVRVCADSYLLHVES